MKRLIAAIFILTIGTTLSIAAGGLGGSPLSPVPAVGGSNYFTINNVSIFTNSSWQERTTYYVSPLFGSDSNAGSNRATPFLTYVQAANMAYSNAPSTIVLMAGTYLFPGTNGNFNDYFIIPPFVNVVGEASNQVVVTFTNTIGSLTVPGMQPCGTNQIVGVNFTFNSGSSSDVPLGNFFVNNTSFLPLNYANVTFGGTGIPATINEVYFKGCTFMFAGTGIHFEGAASSTIFAWDFNECRFLCNNNFIQMREAGPLITIENSDVTLRNWTNVPVINGKPFRMLETRTLPNIFSNIPPVRIQNTLFHVYDTELSASNRPFYFVWNTLNTTNLLVATNIFALQGCTIDETLTNPTSIDLQPVAYNANTQCVMTVNNVIRTDTGGPLTVSSGFSVRTLTNNFEASLVISAPSNSAPFTSVSQATLHTIALNKGWTNDFSCRADLVLNVVFTNSTTLFPQLVFTNTTTGDSFTNGYSTTANGTNWATIVYPDINPNDTGTISNYTAAGGGGTANILSAKWRLK